MYLLVQVVVIEIVLSPFALCRTVVVENVVYRTVISAGASGVFSPY